MYSKLQNAKGENPSDVTLMRPVNTEFLALPLHRFSRHSLPVSAGKLNDIITLGKVADVDCFFFCFWNTPINIPADNIEQLYLRSCLMPFDG